MIVELLCVICTFFAQVKRMCLSVLLLHYEKTKALMGDHHPLMKKLKSQPSIAKEDQLLEWSKKLQNQFLSLSLPAENIIQQSCNKLLMEAIGAFQQKVW